MNCPVDNDSLTMTVREGVEIDYCPTCRGVWLDRGELDKIIERTNSEYYHYAHGSDHNEREHGQERKKKKGSFIGGILGGLGGD